MAGRRRIVTLQPPLGGLFKGMAYQDQPPFTTPDCSNVRPVGTLERRTRIGSRPGTSKRWATELGGGEPIRLAASVRRAGIRDTFEFLDNFTGTNDDPIGASWTAMTEAIGKPLIQTNRASLGGVDPGAGALRAAALSLVADLDIDRKHTISAVTSTSVRYTIYYFYMNMDDTTPASTDDGVVYLKIRHKTAINSYQAYLYEVRSGSPVLLDSISASGYVSVVSMTLEGTSITVALTITGGSDSSLSGTRTESPAGTRVGFGIERSADGWGSGDYVVDDFTWSYSTISSAPRNLQFASSNGNLYYQTSSTVMDEVEYNDPLGTADIDLASDRLLHAVDRAGKLYIADWSYPLEEANVGDVNPGDLDNASNRLDCAGVADWTTNVDKEQHLVEITECTDETEVANGIYIIKDIHATNGLELYALDGVTQITWASDETCSFRIVRPPKYVDPDAPQKNKPQMFSWYSTTAGNSPVSCPLIARYRDRMVLAGDKANPHVFYMSRQRDPHDWDYGAAESDAQRAVAGTLADAGLVGEPIRAMIASSDDYLLFGCQDSLWILRGDPAMGGSIDSLSQDIGIIDSGACCGTPEGGVVFLSRRGLYEIAPGGMSFPSPISQKAIPAELIDVDTDAYTITMAFDSYDNGIHIFLSRGTGGVVNHWWLDWQTRGLWPVSLPYVQDPTSIAVVGQVGHGASDVVLGCRDGYLRELKDANATDDSTEITSYVFLGPIGLGGSGYAEGILHELVAVLDEQSGDVDWEVYVGKSPEAALAAGAFATAKTWSAGLNYKSRPMARGTAMFLKLANNTTDAWVFEGITAVMRRAGMQRKL